MAKQSGIHQLRGKVGEHSYYRQTGVSSGLVRQINQGMSARVKTEEAFANTRRNNVEFGGAGGVAGVLGGIVSPKFRPMILPFSQSKMATAILELVKQNTAPWGQRVVTSAQTEQLAGILTSTSKTRLADFATVEQSFDAQDGAVTVEVSMSTDQRNTLISMGASGVVIKATQFDLATGKYEPAFGRVHASGSRMGSAETADCLLNDVVGESFDLKLNPFNVDPNLFNTHRVFVVVLMPYRTVGGQNFTLQEHCMFACYKANEE